MSTTPTAEPRGIPDATELAARYGLSPVGVRPPLREYLRSLWARRHFAVALARARVRARTSKDLLGPLWTFIQPLLLAGTYLLIFGLLVGAGRGIENYAAYLSIGVFCFHFTTQSVNAGARSVTGNGALVRQLQFPRVLLPVVTTLQQVILLGPTVAVLLAVVLITGEVPSPKWLLLVPIFALQTVFNVGVAMFLARLAAQSHDVLQALPFVLRLWFYMSGVFWSVERVADYPVLKFLFEVNPGFVFIHLSRDALLPDVPPTDYASWPLAVGWSLVAVIVGLIYFWRGEERFGRP